MPNHHLSSETCTRIIRFVCTPTTQYTQRTLSALSLTCKTFQREATPRLYHSIGFSDARRAFLLCQTLVHSPGLGAHVHSFVFSQGQDSFSMRTGRTSLGHNFWAAIHAALGIMKNLEHLVLLDSSFANSWVLDALGGESGGDDLSGRKLTEVKLRFAWDEHLVRFLERQTRLVGVQVWHSLDYTMLRPAGVLCGGYPEKLLAQGSLPALRLFDGTLAAGLDVVRVGAPLTNMQVFVKQDAADLGEDSGLGEDMKGFADVGRTLKSLNLLDVPEEIAGEVIKSLAEVCPRLEYFGLLPLPVIRREQFTLALISLPSLRYIYLDISGWLPQAHTGAQRVLATELKMYCPSIRHIVFWSHTTRYKWHYSQEQWHHQVEPHQHPHNDHTWSTI